MNHSRDSNVAWTTTSELIKLAFIASLGDDVDSVCLEESYTIDISPLDFLDTLKDLITTEAGIGLGSKGLRVTCVTEVLYSLILYGHENKPVLLVQLSWQSSKSVTTKTKVTFSITASGIDEPTRRVITAANERFGRVRLASVKWWYMKGDKMEVRSVILDEPKPIHPEYYPWIENGPSRFFADYLASEASILFLMGKMGTGKTSLLRRFLYDNNLSAMVSYDEKMLTTDYMFVEFMLSDTESVLIIEDADLMLTAREHNGNQMIARFLNVSDGLIKFPHKKIIFTTNMENVTDIDPALSREGRCFASLDFRALTYSESRTVTTLAHLPLPEEHRNYTLGELFNQTAHVETNRKKFGF